MTTSAAIALKASLNRGEVISVPTFWEQEYCRPVLLRHYHHWTPDLLYTLLCDPANLHAHSYRIGQEILFLLKNPHLSRDCHVALLRILATGRVITLSLCSAAIRKLAAIVPDQVSLIVDALRLGRFTSNYCLFEALEPWAILFTKQDWDLVLRSSVIKDYIKDVVLQCPSLPSKYYPALEPLPPHLRTPALVNNPLAIEALGVDVLAGMAPGYLLSIRAILPQSCREDMTNYIDTRLVATNAGLRLLASRQIAPTVSPPKAKVAQILASKGRLNVKARTNIVQAIPKLLPKL